jgi:hypothetical protein
MNKTLTPMPQKDFELTVKNVVAACKDINKLNKRGYNFLYLCSGFIAHYNIHGFKDYYSQYSLKRDLFKNKMWNQWGNFGVGESNAAYYHQKRDIYNAILEKFDKTTKSSIIKQ